MVNIGKKKQRQCLYYARRNSIREIKEIHSVLSKAFETSKYNKHAFKGKTTRHRKGKVERKHAKCRYSVHLAALVIYYKKQLLNNKEVNLEELECKKTLNEFLTDI